MGGYVEHMWGSGGVYRFWMGKAEGKRTFGRHMSGWKDNIKVDLQNVGYEVMDLIDMAKDGYRWRGSVNAVMNFRVP